MWLTKGTMKNYRRQVANARTHVKVTRADPNDGKEYRSIQRLLPEHDLKLLELVRDEYGLNEREGWLGFQVEFPKRYSAMAYMTNSAPACSLTTCGYLNNMKDRSIKIPFFVLDKAKNNWLKHDFCNTLMAPIRFPQEIKSLEGTKSLHRGEETKSMNAIDNVEVFNGVIFAMFFKIMSEPNNEKNCLDCVMIVRSLRIYLNNYAEIEDREYPNLVDDIERNLENQDTSFQNALALDHCKKGLDPRKWFAALFHLPLSTRRSKIPALWHIVLGLLTKPEGITVSGMRPHILRMVFERAAKHLPSRKITDTREYINAYTPHMSATMKLWVFITDAMQLFQNDAFMYKPEICAKQLSFLAQNATDLVNLQDMVNHLSPSTLMTAEDMANLLLKCGEVAKKEVVDSRELNGGESKSNLFLQKKEQLRQLKEGWQEDGTRAAALFMRFNPSLEVAGIIKTHIMTKQDFATFICTANYLSYSHNKAAYDALWSKLSNLHCVSIRRRNNLWNFYNSSNKNIYLSYSRYINNLAHDEVKEDDEKEDIYQEPEQLFENVRIALLHKVMDEFEPPIPNTCPICFEEFVDAVTCCEAKHCVCKDCRQQLPGTLCPLCRRPLTPFPP